MTGTLFIFLKEPVAGRVKTRLGAEIGMGRAAALFRVMTQQTIARTSKGPWQTVLAVDPPTALSGFNNLWPPHLPRIAQAQGSLGVRMSAAFEAAPRGPVIIIGADAPDLRPRHIREAFSKLGSYEAVFGPAEDGGYWLIGLARRRGAPGLFEDVRWSTKHALSDTRASLPDSFRTFDLNVLRDIDTASDLTAMGLLSTG